MYQQFDMGNPDLTGQPRLSDEDVREHTYSIATRGYTVVADFLDPQACEALKAGLARAVEDYKPCGTERSVLDRYHIHDLLCRDVMFARLLEDSRLQQLLAPVLGEHWVIYAFTSSSLPPGGSNYGRRIHVDSPRQVPGYVFNAGVIWALDEFTVANGGTELLPGSQHLPDNPSEAYFERNFVQLTCPRGSVIVFDARVFHRSGDNRSEQWRYALTMNACRSFMKQRMDWVRFIPEEIATSLNEQGQRILGYYTRVPTNLDEFFVPEGERLYRANQG